MARLTVSDCLQHIENRYDLVIIAYKRARQLAEGAASLLESSDEKPSVVALREIAAGLITEENAGKLLSKKSFASAEERETQESLLAAEDKHQQQPA